MSDTQPAYETGTLFSRFKHVTYFLAKFSSVGYKADGEKDEDRSPKPFAESNVFSSRLDLDGVECHTLAIDLDVPAVLIPSSTPGHSHLYIDKEMSWERYEAILKALGDAGILEVGYVAASIERRHTSLRFPWVKKQPESTMLQKGY